MLQYLALVQMDPPSVARREFRPGSARILLRAVLADFDLADEPLTFSHSFPACAFLSGRRKGGKLPSLPQGECLSAAMNGGAKA